jgi:hypothetical protein
MSDTPERAAAAEPTGSGDSLQSIIAALDQLQQRFTRVETHLEQAETLRAMPRDPILLTDPNATAGDPLSTLDRVLDTIAHATSAPSDAQIAGYVAICRDAIVALRAGAGVPADAAGAPHARFAYLMRVHDAYLEVMGVLLDAVRSNGRFAPFLVP